MKSFLKNITQFILLWLPFHAIVVLLWSWLSLPGIESNVSSKAPSTGHLKERLQDLKTHQNVDLLFLGSSLSYRGFDPRLFAEAGYSSFNLGSSSQSPIQTQLLLQRYLKQLQPKVVFYEMYPGPFSNDGVESGLDLISHDLKDLDALKMAWKCKSIKLIQSWFVMKLLKVKTKKSQSPNSETYIKGGFVEQLEIGFNPNRKAFPKRDLNPEQVNAFKQNINFLKASGATVILINAPVSNYWYSTYPALNDFHELIKESELPYLDYTQMPELVDSLHFFDANHLNQAGVKIFNQKLIKDHLLDRTIF